VPRPATRATTVGRVHEVTEPDGASFQSPRQRLFGIAYRVLGNASEAEDVVLDAWIRWQRTEIAPAHMRGGKGPDSFDVESPMRRVLYPPCRAASSISIAWAARVSTRSGQRAVCASCWEVLPWIRRPTGP
jgi:hypothetical protein